MLPRHPRQRRLPGLLLIGFLAVGIAPRAGVGQVDPRFPPLPPPPGAVAPASATPYYPAEQQGEFRGSGQFATQAPRQRADGAAFPSGNYAAAPQAGGRNAAPAFNNTYVNRAHPAKAVQSGGEQRYVTPNHSPAPKPAQPGTPWLPPAQGAASPRPTTSAYRDAVLGEDNASLQAPRLPPLPSERRWSPPAPPARQPAASAPQYVGQPERNESRAAPELTPRLHTRTDRDANARRVSFDAQRSANTTSRFATTADADDARHALLGPPTWEPPRPTEAPFAASRSLPEPQPQPWTPTPAPRFNPAPQVQPVRPSVAPLGVRDAGAPTPYAAAPATVPQPSSGYQATPYQAPQETAVAPSAPSQAVAKPQEGIAHPVPSMPSRFAADTPARQLRPGNFKAPPAAYQPTPYRPNYDPTLADRPLDRPAAARSAEPLDARFKAAPSITSRTGENVDQTTAPTQATPPGSRTLVQADERFPGRQVNQLESQEASPRTPPLVTPLPNPATDPATMTEGPAVASEPTSNRTPQSIRTESLLPDASPRVIWGGVNPNLSGQRIDVRPPRMQFDSQGQMFLAPNMAVSNAPRNPEPLLHGSTGPFRVDLEPSYANEVIGPDLSPVAEPIFNEVVQDGGTLGYDECCPPARRGWLDWLFGCEPWSEKGIGHERVIHAPFEIATTQPMNNIRMRLDAAYDVEFPDRAEFLWAKIRGARNPLAVNETSTNYQDMRFMLELGGGSFSTQMDFPIRILDPDNNLNTAGMGDMQLTTKTVLVDGMQRWQLTQIFRTTFNTGSPAHRTGSGNIKLEPGLLCRFKIRESTYAHSEITYVIPTAGDPLFSGRVLRYGLGFSHVYYETDTFAAIPTLEFVGWSVLGGFQTDPLGVPEPVDGAHIFSIHPGVRFVADTDSDLGLWEMGIASGFTVTNDSWYRGLLRLDLRISF